ncbi:MAG: hypothetical protein IIU03_11070 [Bacteroidales bacterium]|nr:hypothetical protein [Bacteroidales bacterium]
MINKEITTYKELLRAKNAYSFAKYYDLDNGLLNFIYDFTADPNNRVVGNDTSIMFYTGTKLVKSVSKPMITKAKSVSITDDGFYVVPVYTPSSYSSYSSSSGSSYSSGGGSSNNNNNNNNNTNNG